MAMVLRAGRPEDADVCGRICYEAFAGISGKHGFPADFPSPEVAIGLMGWILSRDDVYSVLAEKDGRVVGSNFLWEDAVIAGVGPITVDASTQDSSVGRQLMENIMQRAQKKRFPGVRLCQAAFHSRSLSLYTKLGFDVREPLACMSGPPIKGSIPGYIVRAAGAEDMDTCNALCRRIHGFERGTELSWAIQQKTALVAEYDGRISGYAGGIGFFAHAVAETNDGLKALIAGAPEISGPGLLLPARNGEMFRWCLQNGLRVVQCLNLMSMGLYMEPKGAFMPSVLY